MHIEPGIVTGAKLVLSYATGIAAGGVALKLAAETDPEAAAEYERLLERGREAGRRYRAELKVRLEADPEYQAREEEKRNAGASSATLALQERRERSRMKAEN